MMKTTLTAVVTLILSLAVHSEDRKCAKDEDCKITWIRCKAVAVYGQKSNIIDQAPAFCQNFVPTGYGQKVQCSNGVCELTYIKK